MSSEPHDDRTPRTDTPGDWVRPRLGKYTLLKPLAEGGMGQVYLAQRDGSDRICVLKTLRPDVVNDETSRRRFLREARLAAFLDHPNIARLLDAGDEDGTFCIALEFIAGKDIESMMHELIRKGRLMPFEASVSAMVGILDGLEAAHTAKDPAGQPMNIVHRDLSPRNMMLTFDGEAKVIDFGVARASINDFKTAPGMVMGTFRYVSPEMATASPVDHRSDVYAAGVVLYELLTGQAVVGQTANPVDMLRAVVLQSPAPLHSVNPAAPAALSPVIMRALEKNPGQRWQSAAEFRAAIVAAVPEMAHFPKPQLGLFLRTWFPGDAAAASAVVELSNFAEPSERTRTFVLDLEPVAPKDLDTMEVELETKTGLIFPPAPGGPAPSVTSTVVLEPTVAAQTRLIDRSQSQRSVRPAPPPAKRGPWTHVLTAVVASTVTAAVVIGTRPAPEPQTIAVPVPSAEGRPVPAVGARTVVSQEPSPTPTRAPVRSAAPGTAVRSTPSATPAPSSAEPARARGHATPELLRLLGKLEKSLMQPLADDPALNPFLDEARRIVATLPKGSEAEIQLRAISAEPSVARAQQLVRALEAQ